jgi:membrane protease YdiL (CAAX protease family)
MSATISPAAPPTSPAAKKPTDHVPLVWVGFVLASLLALDLLSLTVWSIAVPLAAATLWLVSAGWWRSPSIRLLGTLDQRDLAVIAALYLAVVGLWRLAFTVFSADRWLGLFLCFGGGMLLGVVVPVIHTVWLRRRPLASLGIGTHQLRTTLALGVLFGGVQAVTMLWAYRLPAPVDWVPLLVGALTVGLFEAIFFRGFIQGRLEASIGTGPAAAGAALLYALYHVGYGMGLGRAELPVRPGRGLRRRLPAHQQHPGAVAAADPPGRLVQHAGVRRHPHALGGDPRLRRRAGAHGAGHLAGPQAPAARIRRPTTAATPSHRRVGLVF